MLLSRVFVVVLLGVTGCASAGLGKAYVAPEAEKLRVYKSDPPPECEDLGTVGGGMTWSGADEQYRVKMKNEAYQKGANYVRLDTATTGTAFRCP